MTRRRGQDNRRTFPILPVLVTLWARHCTRVNVHYLAVWRGSPHSVSKPIARVDPSLSLIRGALMPQPQGHSHSEKDKEKEIEKDKVNEHTNK